MSKSASFPIFGKLIVMFLLAIVPLYGISLLINQAASNNLKSEISRSFTAQSEYYLQALEVEVDRLQTLQRDYVNDEGLQRMSVQWSIMSSYDRTEAIIGLRRRLQIIKNTSPNIENVSAYIPEVGHSISTSDLFAPLPWDFFHTFRSGEGKGKRLIQQDGRMFLSFSYPDAYTNDELMPNYMLIIELSIPQLASVLDRMIGNRDGGAALINPDWAIFSGNQGPRSAQIAAGLLDSLTFQQNEAGIETIHSQHRNYMVVYRKSSVLQAVLVVFLPESTVLGPLQSYRIWFWVLSFASSIIVVAFAYWIYRQIHQPLLKLLRAFRRAEEGDLNTAIQVQTRDEFHYIYEQFNRMVGKLKISLKEAVEQRTKAQRSELKQLQMQINPHFLYNSFFILHGLAKLHDNETVIRLSSKLGQYFRFLTRSGKDEVELRVEVEHALAYVEIQTIRFAYRIEVEVEELPLRFSGLIVPRLILQPIIENAYQHGLERKAKGGKLSIRFDSPDDCKLVITVEDNGVGLEAERLDRLAQFLVSADEASEFTGLINVHRRLLLRYGKDSGLTVSNGMEGGLKVRIEIVTS